MPSPTVRASATALPKSNNHPDAALLALADKFLQSQYLAASKACEAAEEKRPIASFSFQGPRRK